MSDSPDSGAANPEGTEDTANIANTESTASAPDAADAVEPDDRRRRRARRRLRNEHARAHPGIPNHRSDARYPTGAALSATAFACAAFLVHRYMEPAIPPPGREGWCF